MKEKEDAVNDTLWCACARSFSGADEFRTHTWALSSAKHHRSYTVASNAPVLPGGVIRTVLDTTDDQRITADLTVMKVMQYACGCWGAKAERPGPDAGPCTCRYAGTWKSSSTTMGAH